MRFVLVLVLVILVCRRRRRRRRRCGQQQQQQHTCSISLTLKPAIQEIINKCSMQLIHSASRSGSKVKAIDNETKEQ